jgi:hypothetical protein
MLSGHCPSWTCYLSQATGQVTQGSCKVERESIPSSRSATEAYRGVRLRRRILSKPAPLDTASTAFQPLGMLALNVSRDFARALVDP